MRRVLLPRHIDPEAAPAGAVVHALAGHSMGTGWTARLVLRGVDVAALAALRQGLQAQLDRVVAQMSHWDADSDLGRFNRAAAGSWHALPAEFFHVLAYAQQVWAASGGACDPGAGALVNLWGFGPVPRYDQPGFRAPSHAQARALRAAQAGLALELDHANRRARQPGGLLLDLSAVAKGYGVDCLARYLDQQGIHHYLVEVGGELRGAGVKPDGQPWWVTLEQDEAEVAAAVDTQAQAQAQAHRAAAASAASTAAPLLALHGLAVATSGDYRRYFERDGQRHPHTIDPRSGLPIANGLAAVSVVHAQCMAADAWSTALTVLGLEQGLALAERLGLAARFVRRGVHGASETLSSAMRAMLEDPC